MQNHANVKENPQHALSCTADLMHLFLYWLLFGLWVAAINTPLITSDDPWHEVWVILGLLTQILADPDMALALQRGHHKCEPVVTEIQVTQLMMLMLIKQFNLDYWLMAVTACTCSMYITMQCPVHVQQDPSWKCFISPHKYTNYWIQKIFPEQYKVNIQFFTIKQQLLVHIKLKVLICTQYYLSIHMLVKNL